MKITYILENNGYVAPKLDQGPPEGPSSLNPTMWESLGRFGFLTNELWLRAIEDSNSKKENEKHKPKNKISPCQGKCDHISKGMEMKLVG